MIGHQAQEEQMKEAIRNKRVAHGYCFEGPEAIGKKKMAFNFAMDLLCRQGEGHCGVCHSCQMFAAGNHPDFHVYMPEGRSIKREQAEAAIHELQIRSYEGGYKIFLFDDADKMTASAQNALLKSLEEPPAQTVIVLVTANPQGLLPTIRSRVQAIRFYPVKETELVIGLKKRGVDPDTATTLARLSEGRPGHALSLLESKEFQALQEASEQALLYLLSPQSLQIVPFLALFEKRKEEADAILNDFLNFFRDVLVMKTTRDDSRILNPARRIQVKETARRVSEGAIYGIIEQIIQTKEQLRRNLNLTVGLQQMFRIIQEEISGNDRRHSL
jgi:DNA polymerase-3 subunit delta'